MKKNSKAKEVAANTKSIFLHLCEQMEKLDNAEIGVEQAKAQAVLAKQANNVLRYELDRAKFVEKHGSENIRNIEN